MQAVICEKYGPPDVLKLKEVIKPTPKDNQLLIKIYAAGVTSGDRRVRGYTDIPAAFWLPMRLVFGITKPRNSILGSEISGEVEAVGKDVTLFKQGDAVYGYTGFGFGGYADYICLPEKAVLAPKPSNMTHAEAVTIPFGALTALNFVRRANIKKGQKVLINGASGGVGRYTLQLAKQAGAEVTGVCRTSKLEMVKSLGADHVIDYTQTDFATTGETYDIVFDMVHTPSLAHCQSVLKPNGSYILAVFGLMPLFRMAWTSLVGNRKVVSVFSVESAENLKHISELVEAGVLKTVVDRTFPLAETADAHRYIETGDNVGGVVVEP